MTVALTLFGAPTIVYGGKSVALAFERRTQLLVYLAMKRTWVGRAELAALLWPDQDSKLAYTNLRKALFRLQRFPWADRIEGQGSALRFEVDTDVQAFENALREHRTKDALPLYRGALLAGFDDDSNEAWSGWLSFERDRLQSAWRSAAQEQLAGDIDAVEAIDLAARLLDADPLDEAALQAYMTWLARAGQVARARQAYREFVARLADELGLEPGAELKALHDSTRPAAAAVGAASLASKPSRPMTASLAAPSNCGALRRCSRRTTAGCLLITGPGGVGKTRLAQRVLRRVRADVRRRRHLRAARRPDGGERTRRAARRANSALSLKGSAEPFEQVDRSAALATADAAGARQLRATHRRRAAARPAARRVPAREGRRHLARATGLASEWLLPLEGLPCPDDEDRDALESFDAARLFVARRAPRRSRT